MVAALQQHYGRAHAPTAAARPVLTRRMGRELARRFLLELESERLEVVLIPSRRWEIAQRGGKIRAVQVENPEWYQAFCKLYESGRKDRLRWRKFKTAIKRRATKRGLRELIDGRCESVYAQRLRDFIRRHWTEYV